MKPEFFIALERKLLDPEIRGSIIELAELLSDDFEEVSQHGNICIKQDVLEHLPAISKEVIYTGKDFVVTTLSDSIVKVRFLTTSVNADTGEELQSERVSIWRDEVDAWRMVYHQGTPIMK